VDSTITKQVFAERDAPLKSEEERLARRVAELKAEAALGAAAASTQRVVLAHARLLRAGVDRLDDEQWRAFLVKLVEKIVVGPDALELHLVLPTTQASQRSNQASSKASTLARSGGLSFSSSW